jgi:hypothetical protein
MSIEQFIQQNRDAFDTDVPSAAVWDSISRQLSETKPVKPHGWTIWKNSRLSSIAAAVALLLIGTGIGVGISKQSLSNDEAKVFASVSPEFQEAADYYQRDINAKREKLAQFASQKNSVEADLVQLEQVMNELKAELNNIPPARRQAVVAAMIENYKMRASILEKVLQKIEKQNTQQNEPTHI